MQKNEILPFATMWTELEGITLSEVSQSEKDRYQVFTHMWSLRNLTKNLRGKGRKNKLQREKANDKRLLNTENKLRVDGGGVWGDAVKMGDGSWGGHL